MQHSWIDITERELSACIWLAADEYFRSTIPDLGYLDKLELLEDLAPAVLRLRRGDSVGITLAVEFVYQRNALITEPREEIRRCSTIHVEVLPNSRLDSRVLLEWGDIWLWEGLAK